MKIPEPIPAEGINIPVKVAFSGIKNVPLISLAHNSISPKLLLFEEATETRVLFMRRRILSEIESIDVSESFSTFHLTINWKKRLFDFTAGIESVESLLAVLEFFQRKDLTLHQTAQNFMAEAKKV